MTESNDNACPLSQREIIDTYFMENRSRILDVAAFLDRLERARVKDAEDDFRFRALREAMQALVGDSATRTKDIQMILSDPKTDLLDERDQQSADGAARE
tara:strand:+ start:1213 stop:1512 length:300 start_codon:yes stop_codon:yes gene_type:complete